MLDLQKIITQKLENSKIDKRFSNRIRHFFGRFCAGNYAEKYGLGHGIFVCYAAFPVLLTPELLHKLWFNFKNYRYHANNYTIHPVAVTDVIMGGMCQEIMRNTYEMPEPIRFFLLDILQNHLADTATLAGLTLSNDNQNIVEQLAHFTKQFALHSFDPDNRFTKSTQKSLLYGADIYLSPAQTLQQIAQDFASAKNNPNQQQQLSLATDSMLQMLQQMNTNVNSASATPTNYTAQLHLLLTYNNALKRFYMEGATDSVVQKFRVLLEQQTNYTTNSLLLPLPINPNSDTNAISIVLVYVPSDTALVIELKKEISKEMKDSNIAFEEILCRDENPIIDEKQMAQQFSRATTILLMLSAAALNSNSFYKTTASNAFRYCPLVIPTLLRPCLWNRTPLGAINPIPNFQTKTISEYKEEGTAQVYEIVAKEINHAITKSTTDINTYNSQLADELLANFTGEPTQLLVLYAEEDTAYWQNLIIHVSSIRRFINVEVKSLSCQNANLSTMIAQQMATTHAVLPLLSDDFLVNSDFFIETLATQNQIPIIPILAKKCKWENSFFSTFHPTNSAPIELADNQDVAYYEISTAISRFLEEIKKEQVDTNEPIDNRKQLFFIYNQQDLEHLKNTEQHLGPLKSYIKIWHKDKMVVGDKTAAITKQKLQEADFVLPLVSTHFLADEDGIELLTLANTLNKEIMPILVDTCEWEAFGILNTKTFLPISDNHTLAISSDQWEEEDNAYISIVTTIHHTVVTHQRIQEAQATNATRLDLSKLGLTEIPEGITALTHLQELDLSNNKITDISILLPLYQKGVNIVVEGNPITNPPAEVVQQGREVVLRWLEDYIEKGGIPLNEAKLIIIGAGGVGKTSLMNKLLNLNAPLPPPDATTVGITVVNQPITYTINNTEYKMHIWDFGGQDLYHPTHQFFFTPNSIYILLEDGREKKTDFYYWLHIQELLGGNSPLFILQNVRNKSRSELPLNEMRGKFGNIKEYFEMDLSEVKEGHGGFGKLVGELQANLKNLPHIGEVWPRKRYEIRDELLKRHDQNYISLKAYRKICDEKGY
ncbi:MAG TPA: hypothetical protein PK230_02975, partial [Chitinophagales bacterium]|nr:hypothetical protein [Chitinophagales bacterium]